MRRKQSSFFRMVALAMVAIFHAVTGYHDNRIDTVLVDDNANGHGEVRGLLYSVLDRLTSLDQRLNNFELQFTSLESQVGRRFTSLESQVGQRFTSLDQRLNNFEQRFTSLDQSLSSQGQRFTSLEHRFNNLDQQMTQLGARLSPPLLIQGCPDGPATPDNASTTPPAEKNTTAVNNTATVTDNFRIRRVSKVETEDMYKVTIEYDGPSTPDVFIDSWNPLPRQIPHEEFGSLFVDFPKTGPTPVDEQILRMDFDEQVLRLDFPKGSFRLVLKLNGTPSAMDVPQISMKVTPTGDGVTGTGNDIIFQPGSDPMFDFRFKMDAEDYAATQVNDHYIIYTQSDEKLNTVISEHSYVNEEGHEPFDSSLDVWLNRIGKADKDGSNMNHHDTVLINSTREDIEGLLDIKMGVQFNCSENCLVSYLQIPLSVRFYRSDHDGPFPENFLALMVESYDLSPPGVDYDSVQYCSSRDNPVCMVWCGAFGDDVSTQIVRVDSDVTENVTNSVTMKINQWASETVVQSDVAEAEGEYQCVVNNGQRNVTRTIFLDVIKEPRFDRNASKVVKLDNGSLLITCVADGNPAPNVTFDPLYDVNDDEYVITRTEVDEFTNKIEVLISNPEVASKVSDVTCKAKEGDMTGSGWGMSDVFYMYKDSSGEWSQ